METKIPEKEEYTTVQYIMSFLLILVAGLAALAMEWWFTAAVFLGPLVLYAVVWIIANYPTLIGVGLFSAFVCFVIPPLTPINILILMLLFNFFNQGKK